MKFFAENEYGKHYPAIRNELLYRDEAELDKILCGIVNYPDDDRIRSEYGTDPDLYSAIVRYRDFCIGKGDKTLLSKEERLALVKDDRDKTLYDAKMRYMNYALKDWARRDAVDASISETEEEEIPGDQEVKNWRSVLTSIFH
ncbi:hypothetical protein QJS10_CPA16g00787 [Acorus calamus]|uniref:Uncharacterized protein n=1 Tax=Acorus calamus TaxID=4465 RepID=A0AAV9D2J7_ACOCL|nr:hypothetical protein QJS10_CPA16g00787 [Acorus calamus]